MKPIQSLDLKQKLLWLVVSTTILGGCSGSGSCRPGDNNSSNGDVSALQIIAPKTIFSKPAETSPGYIVIKNPTDTAVTNLHYDLSNLVGGATGTIIDPDSAANCATMAAHGQCNVKVMIPAGAVAGSFGFSANNDNSLLSKLGKVFNDSVIKTSNLTIGIQQAAYNNLSGADGITLSYYHTVINGVPYILVTGLVASANAGSFNNIVLVDNNGNAIPGQSLIGNSSGYTQGTTFHVLLPVPVGGGISQTIKVQTQQVSNGQTKVVSTSTSSSTLSTTEAGASVGIVNMLPDAVYLTQEHPEQTITFSNSGDAAAQLQSLLASNPNIEVIFSPGSLNGAGGTTTAIIKLKDPSKPATSGGLIFTYNNGQQEVKDSVVVEENVNPAPTPGPSPTPPPTPPSPPAPAAGLTATLSPNNDFFTTTVVGRVSNQMTITNTGNTTENNIILTLPAGFTIADGSSNSCTITQGTSPPTISNDLAANTGSCDVTVTYTNSAVTSQTVDSISITYDYNNSTPAPSPAIAAVNYRVTQSTANLALQSPTDSFSFPTTLLEGLGATEQQVYTIKNTGDGEATSMNGVVNSTTSAGLFSSYTAGLTNACGATLAAGASCKYGVQFGAIPDGTSAGQKNGNLTVSYKTYPAAASSTALVANFYGQVATAKSAKFETPQDGTAGSSFQGSWPNLAIQRGTASDNTITYTITNSGTDAATNFRITLPGAPNGWYAPTTDCPTTTGNNLAINGSCTVQITPVTTNETTIATTNLTIGMAWSDQDSPSGETQNMQLPLPAVEVYAPATIAITPATTSGTPTSVVQGGMITITATLSGGYNVQPQTIHADNGTGSATFSNSGNCTITSPATTCTITATIAADATVAPGQTIALTNTTTSTLVPNPATIYYDIGLTTVTKYIFVTSDVYNGDLKTTGGGTDGLDGANKICQSQADATGSLYKNTLSGATWKALLAQNTATHLNTIYKSKIDTNPDHDIIIATNTADTDNIWSWTSSDTLSNKIMYTQNGGAVIITSLYAWSGATPADFSSSGSPSGWSNYSNTAVNNTCDGWTSSNSANDGIRGFSNSLKPSSATTTLPAANTGILINGASACNLSFRLRCVQQ